MQPGYKKNLLRKELIGVLTLVTERVNEHTNLQKLFSTLSGELDTLGLARTRTGDGLGSFCTHRDGPHFLRCSCGGLRDAGEEDDAGVGGPTESGG